MIPRMTFGIGKRLSPNEDSTETTTKQITPAVARMNKQHMKPTRNHSSKNKQVFLPVFLFWYFCIFFFFVCCVVCFAICISVRAPLFVCVFPHFMTPHCFVVGLSVFLPFLFPPKVRKKSYGVPQCLNTTVGCDLDSQHQQKKHKTKLKASQGTKKNPKPTKTTKKNTTESKQFFLSV